MIQNEESGLQRMYLYHSYFKGKLTVIDCIGHTQNFGDNGSGKSSILMLICTFYGKEGSALINRAGEKKSFVDFMLPSQRSMLVFEYLRAGKLKCSVMYRSGNGLAYRFIDSDGASLFNQARMDALSQIKDAHQWIKTVLCEELKVSNQIASAADYRAVLLNDKKWLQRKRKTQRFLAATAHDFSLCSIDTQMVHIDSLATVMLRHDKILSQFKMMVVDSFLSDRVEIGEVPFHKDDAEHINLLSALVKIEERAPALRVALQKDDELKEDWSLLLSLHANLEQAKLHVKQALQEASDTLEKLKAEKKIFEEKADQEISELTRNLNQHKDKLDAKSRLLDAIYEKREQWDNEEQIEMKISQYSQLKDYEDQKDNDEKHYKTLIDAVTSEAHAHQAKIDNIDKTKNKKVTECKDDLADLEKKLAQHQQSTQEKETACRAENYKKLEDYTEEREAGKQRINDKMHSLANDKALAYQHTEEESAKLEALDTQFNHVEQQIETQSGLIFTAQAELASKKKERDSKLLELERKKKKMLAKESEIKSVARQLHPEIGSLHAFLNDNNEDWRESIGKVLRPELFNQKNLHPRICTELNSALYGIEISLEHVEPNEFARSEKELIELRASLDKDIALLESNIEIIKKESAKCNDQITQQEGNLAKNERGMRRFKTEKQRLHALILDTKRGIEQNIKLRVEQVESRISLLKQDLNTHDSQTKAGKDQLKRAVEKEILEIKTAASYIESEINQKIANKKQSIDDLNETAKKQIKELQKAYEAVLSQKGIDPITERVAKERAEQSTQRYELVRSYAGVIYDYQAWEKSHWSKVDEHSKEANQLEARVYQLGIDLQEKTQDYRKKQQGLAVKHAKQKERVNSAEQDNNNVKKVLAEIEDTLSTIPAGHPFTQTEHSDVHLLLKQSIQTANKIKVTRREIAKAVEDVGRILTDVESKGNKLYSIWKNMEQERASLSAHPSHTEQFYVEAVEDLRLFLDTSLVDHKEIAIDALKVVGQRYVGFYQSLQSLNRKVGSVSSLLASEINTSNNFKRISDIKVSLTSKIANFDVWRDLKVFEQAWREWDEKGDGVFPDENVVKTYQSTSDALQSCRIEKNIESLIEIDISMVENGRTVNIRSDADIKNVSSEGLSTLAVIVVFVGMTRYLCKDRKVRIHWPLDELGTISGENVLLLFDLMNEHNISLFCAQPNASSAILRHFSTKNRIDRDGGVKRYISENKATLNPIYASPIYASKESVDEREI